MTTGPAAAAAVDVWVADGAWRAPTDVLPARERAAAVAMGSSSARRRHVRARALLRLVLGQQLGCDPSVVPLQPAGRPIVELLDAPGVGVAHAGDVVVVALRRDGPVGVDVEVLGARHRPVPGVATDRGRTLVTARLRAGRDDADLLAWVVQEAALKAIGVGLAVPLHEVRLAESDGDVLVHVVDRGVCRAVARRRGDALVAVAVPGAAPVALRWCDPPSIG